MGAGCIDIFGDLNAPLADANIGINELETTIETTDIDDATTKVELHLVKDDLSNSIGGLNRV
jgi:hypothetical protein